MHWLIGIGIYLVAATAAWLICAGGNTKRSDGSYHWWADS